jgi:lipopolysaccharide assembly outer membrane protein LptD (OstA)
MFPNEHAVMRAKTDFNTDEQQFSAYTLEGQFRTKRGDSLRSRFRFVDEAIRQLESSAEMLLTDRLKLGYYTRYDDLTSSIIEQKAGLRISSACKCWLFDVTVTDRINPDQTKLQFNITLVGLGEIGNTVFSQFRDENENQ